MQYKDIITLGMGHNLILGNAVAKLPEEILTAAPEHRIHNDFAQFGFFDSSTPNYTTYYPDLTAEDLQPKDSDFIEPVFRALSEVVVHKNYNPVDFSMNGVLKKSMGLLVGMTVNPDHESGMVGNALGSVPKVYWDNAYTADGGVKVPAGINAKLKIDGKSNPRIARGILMDPPSIHSTSVTVEFMWEKSHADLSEEEFFRKLGTYDADGKLIRRIAVEITRYHEISLVAHGADPFAQKVGDSGKIVNPTYASKSYYTKLSDVERKKINQSYFFFDCKQDILQNSDSTIPAIIINNEKEIIDMNKLHEFLAAIALTMGLAAKQDNSPYTEEEVTGQLSALVASKTKAENELIASKAEVDRLKALETELTALKQTQPALLQFQQDRLTDLRNSTIKFYKLSMGQEENATLDDAVTKLIAAANYETLVVLSAQYETAANAKMPLTCGECHSQNVSRRSSIANGGDHGDGGTDGTPKDIKSLSKDKNRKRGVSPLFATGDPA